jgi:hypothetical protein
VLTFFLFSLSSLLRAVSYFWCPTLRGFVRSGGGGVSSPGGSAGGVVGGSGSVRACVCGVFGFITKMISSRPLRSSTGRDYTSRSPTPLQDKKRKFKNQRSFLFFFS